MSNGSVIWTDMHGHQNADNLKGIHLFERVGLGKAPFTVVGYGEHVYQACPGAPIQPGTSCMYCGTGCRYVANILSIDGQKFHVGLDCVMKTGDGGLVQNVKRSAEYRKILREKRHALDARKATEIEQILVRMEADEKLSHSASHFRYRLGWCGAAGRARILRELREFQSSSQPNGGSAPPTSNRQVGNMAAFIVTFDSQTCSYRAHAMGCGAIGKLVILGTYDNLQDCEQAFWDDAVEKGLTGQYSVCECCQDVERVAPLMVLRSKPL